MFLTVRDTLPSASGKALFLKPTQHAEQWAGVGRSCHPGLVSSATTTATSSNAHGLHACALFLVVVHCEFVFKNTTNKLFDFDRFFSAGRLFTWYLRLHGP